VEKLWWNENINVGYFSKCLAFFLKNGYLAVRHFSVKSKKQYSYTLQPLNLKNSMAVLLMSYSSII